MKDVYENPLTTRYASKQMQTIFSADNKFSTWRKLWVALAENEKKLGLAITDEQIKYLKANVDNIDYAVCDKYERQTRHDVMAHVKAYGDACPEAKGIIHLGATSCYVDDNGDIIVMRQALDLVKSRLVGVIDALTSFAEKYADTPTLAFTHFQPAQPTTVGKRACLWAQDLVFDLERLDECKKTLKFAGCKGATGTMASFLSLFDGDEQKTLLLEKNIAKDFGFDEVLDVSGQTYTRKLDYFVLSVLSGIAQSASKFATDIRLLSHLREFDEPFESGQIGSSAMAYKRNPMRSERICSLARYVTVDALNSAITASSQWLERSLDDSANRRISIPEAFLAVDAILILYRNVIENGSVYPAVCSKRLKEELPFIATENIMMSAVKKGGDRQAIHETIRKITTESAKKSKLEGKTVDFGDELVKAGFSLSKQEIDNILSVDNFTGLAKKQTELYVEKLKKVVDENKSLLSDNDEIHC